jgi:type I restriction enzyme S subunit
LTSSRKGIYLQDEYFNRIVASKDISNYKMIKKGEFTYRSMSDDETFVFNRLEDIPVGLVSPAYFVFQVKEGYSGDYPKYLLNNSVEIKRQIYKEIKGTTRVALKFNQLTNFIVPLPPLPEQQKIAEILETIDNAIEKTDKIIEKYKRIKQGLMQDLLIKGIDENGNIRDEKTYKFKDSPLGRIPEEWEVVRLGEIFNIKAGGDIDKLSYCDIKDKRFQYPIFSNTLENKGLYGYSDKFTYPENCITITGRGTLGHAIPRFEKFNAIIRVLVLIPKFEMNIVFVSEYINNKINFIIESTGVPQLTAPKVAEYYIPLPPLPEQQRIAEILSQTDQTIEKEEQHKEKLQKIKQGLMQDLLTGKVRVNHLVEEKENEQRYTSNFTRT